MSYEDRDTFGIYRDNSSGSGSDSAGPGPRLMGADTLIGEDVYNRQQEDLGDIKEIMLDMQSGQVAYAVLSFGGIMGMGEKLFAVPWQSLELDTNNKRFILDASKDQLKSAPGFDKDSWPDMASREFSSQIHDFYGTGQAMPGQRTASGSVMGQGSSNLQSDSFGSQSGSMSGTQSGSLGGSLGRDDNLSSQSDSLTGRSGSGNLSDRDDDDTGRPYRDLSTPPGGSKY
jgi:sporulation protein YlmC with PRC-barrel domain